MQKPSPGRVVMFHFWVDGNPVSRPATVIDVHHDSYVDLHVFFKPGDRYTNYSRDPKYVESVKQSPHPVDMPNVQHENRTWSWPRRVE